MSIQSEVERISTNVQNTLEAIRQTGVSVPENATSDALPAAAASLANEKQDKLTGSQGQVVGFDAEGNAVAQEMPASGGKRMARFVVGTSASGWTAADCDYLCDGTDDQVEINTAIQALPSTGGEIVILDGTYNITATIAMSKDNVKLSGNGAATVLKRMWKASAQGDQAVVDVSAGRCCIGNLSVDGNKENNASVYNLGIECAYSDNVIKNNRVTNEQTAISVASNCVVSGNICENNRSAAVLVSKGTYTVISGNTCYNNTGYGIELVGSSNNIVTGNLCDSNSYSGLYLTSACKSNSVSGNVFVNQASSCGIEIGGRSDEENSMNTITGNVCNNNRTGIFVKSGNKNTVSGNTCMRENGEEGEYSSIQYTIRCNADDNLFIGNIIMGKNYTDDGTNNTWVNNKYN